MENKPICIQCNSEIERGTGKSGRKEENYRYLSRKFCNFKCSGAYMKDRKISVKQLGAGRQLSRATYAKMAGKFRKNNCERCGTDQKLTVHHINKEWWNNDPSNLMTVCNSCHSKIHHEMGDIKTPIGDRLPCRVCGVEYKPGSSRGDLCNKHRLRLSRYGREIKHIEVPKFCSVCGRGGRIIGGYCNSHYLRNKRHGSPLAGGVERKSAKARIDLGE